MNKIEIVTSVGFFISYVEKMHGTKSLKFNIACLVKITAGGTCINYKALMS
jgi:hypothetical protein